MMTTVKFVPDVMLLIVCQAFQYYLMNHSTLTTQSNEG